jgi:hypothetical protein
MLIGVWVTKNRWRNGTAPRLSSPRTLNSFLRLRPNAVRTAPPRNSRISMTVYGCSTHLPRWKPHITNSAHVSSRSTHLPAHFFRRWLRCSSATSRRRDGSCDVKRAGSSLFLMISIERDTARSAAETQVRCVDTERRQERKRKLAASNGDRQGPLRIKPA